MDPNSILQEASQQFQKALDHLHVEYGKIQTGRASAALVEGILVDNYGAKMPLKAVAGISIPDAKTIAIQPWDRSAIAAIEKAIQDSGIGLSPRSDGVVIRLNIPPLTEERRRDLTKVVHSLAEEARIGIRQSRHHAIDQFKSLEKDKVISEDDRLGKEKKLQEKVDEFNQKVEASIQKKEADIMTV